CLAASVIGAPIDCRTAASGATPLHTAALRRQLGAVRKLLHAGADAIFDAETPARRCCIWQLELATFESPACWLVAPGAPTRRREIFVATPLGRRHSGEVTRPCWLASFEKPLLSDSDLSVSLHRNLLAAGFHQLTACLHAATAICRARLTRLCHRGDDENNFEDLRMRLSGTFADCWGAQLACANASLKLDDVEVKLVLPVPGRVAARSRRLSLRQPVELCFQEQRRAAGAARRRPLELQRRLL
uniref:ANK_REP_REGION domain-containing protein n=1 Tax=Macrostomum lignano TaxID=282301 RepID=A0A1I8F9T1_9PLAT